MKALGKRVAKSTGRALLEDYSVKHTQPHFYEEYVQKSDKAVNLTDIVGKPIELSVDLNKNEEKSKKKTLSPTEALAAAPDVEELTSPVAASAGDHAKLELCDDATKDLAAARLPSPSERAKDRDVSTKTKRPSDPCLEPEY